MFRESPGFRRPNQPRQPLRRENFLPRLEALEDRWLPSISVNSVADSGPGSLRAAIMQANTQPGSTIDFTQLGGGPHAINLTSQLPALTANNVTIAGDPSSQEIKLNGFGAGNASGLVLLGKHGTVTGLTIVNFESAGIVVEGEGDTVSECNIGLDQQAKSGPNGNGVYVFEDVVATIKDNDIENNTADGVLVLSSAGITIDTNVMENNANNGIRVAGRMPDSTQPFTTKIINNEIDLNAANGIYLLDSSNNIVGQPGALKAGTANTIGSDKDGIPDEPNGEDGVLIESSTNNTITENYIGGNNGNGVSLTGPETANNSLVNNLIGWGFLHGIDAPGGVLTPLPNKLDGVAITGGAHNNTIGGIGLFLNNDPKTGAGNLIGPNLGNGVRLSDAGTTGNAVLGNLIGTNKSGDGTMYNGNAVSNSLFGVAITDGATNNFIGGKSRVHTSSGGGNLISGNLLGGVDVNGVGTSSNMVWGNFIGTTATGNGALANIGNGVTIEQGATDNSVALDNLISGNRGDGVQITGVVTIHNVVEENMIGTNAPGSMAVANGLDGVVVLGNSDRVIENLISGNELSGVVLGGSQNEVMGNQIGTNFDGTGAVPNQADGILVFLQIGFGGNTIGGTVAGSGNLISGNGGNGIEALGPASLGNLIQGNEIGTQANGEMALANTLNGVLINNTSGYVIGGFQATAGNLISGNKQDGIKITGNLSSGILVVNNRLGTERSAKFVLANQGNGIEIVNQAHGNIIGLGNVISGNVGDGVQISLSANDNLVAGNRIGTDITGTDYVPNEGNGINIFSRASGNTLGGTGAAAANLISGNHQDGVRIDNYAHANVVLGNFIGTDVSGKTPLRNHGNGVDILSQASSNMIGMVSPGGTVTGNLISGNSGSGVVISSSSENVVQGNRIGTTQSGLASLPNLANGVALLTGASQNQIGVAGTASAGGASNLISGNKLDGVRIGNADSNFVTGNLIGTDITGQAPLGNSGHGVFLFSGAQNNFIGGGVGNVIAFNGKAGVAVGGGPFDFATAHNPILSNSIFANHGLGIDLADNGVTLNTLGGPHLGPNDFQNYPLISAATAFGAATTIQLSLNSIPNMAFVIQVFANPAADPTEFGQGQTLIATATPLVLSTDATGNGALTTNIPQDLTGQYLTVTATALGSFVETSEFSKDYLVTGAMMATVGRPGTPAQNSPQDWAQLVANLARSTDTNMMPLQDIMEPAWAGTAAGTPMVPMTEAGLVLSQQLQDHPEWSEMAGATTLAATDVLDQLFAGPDGRA
ncbi:MAG TPA: right-handed parallel beta-helix repeat-containing protein [Gemmataceae bacterium]|nr:right-handed parallel beta-helix repeat-containing protein [Gemmataceae bacterium]